MLGSKTGWIAALAMLGSIAHAQGVPERQIYKIGNGVSPPSLLSKVEPEYTEEARQAHWQGEVGLQLVVDENGLPQDIKVTRSLGLGLDQKAIEAVGKWRFRPALKNGLPVAVYANVQVNFRLADPPFGAAAPPPSSAEKQALVEEILTLTNWDQTVKQITASLRPMLEQQLASTIEKGLPSGIDRAKMAADIDSFKQDYVNRIIDRFRAEFRPIAARAYADAFSAQELHDIVGFLHTPSGRAMIDRTPQITLRSTTEAQAAMVRFLPELQPLVREWIVSMQKKYSQ